MILSMSCTHAFTLEGKTYGLRGLLGNAYLFFGLGAISRLEGDLKDIFRWQGDYTGWRSAGNLVDRDAKKSTTRVENRSSGHGYREHIVVARFFNYGAYPGHSDRGLTVEGTAQFAEHEHFVEDGGLGFGA